MNESGTIISVALFVGASVIGMFLQGKHAELKGIFYTLSADIILLFVKTRYKAYE